MRVAIETSGCAHNRADGETLGAILELHGHVVVEETERADVVVLNTCTVKDNAFRSFEKRLRALEEEGRRVVVAGCIPSADPGHSRWSERVVVGVNNLTDISLAVEAAAADRGTAFLDGTATPERAELPSRTPTDDSVIEVVPISQGCLSSCSFCETKLARGDLVSYSVEALVNRICRALDRGVMEIWLTSQDSGVYGRDRGGRLGDLLKALARIPGEFRVRFGMANPSFLLDQCEEVANALASPTFFKFAHLPVQSGSNAVLRRMRRDHTVEDWVRLCESLRAVVSDLTIATDVIVGFPGETEDDFEATLAALEQVRPAVVNRSKFSPRPLTDAAGMAPRVVGAIVRERSVRLDQVVRRLSRQSLAGFEGRRVRCLVDQRRKPGSILARTDSYRPVAIPAEGDAPLGRFIETQIVQAKTWHLVGNPLRDANG